MECAEARTIAIKSKTVTHVRKTVAHVALLIAAMGSVSTAKLGLLEYVRYSPSRNLFHELKFLYLGWRAYH
jgi:hypothetical protein